MEFNGWNFAKWALVAFVGLFVFAVLAVDWSEPIAIVGATVFVTLVGVCIVSFGVLMIIHFSSSAQARRDRALLDADTADDIRLLSEVEKTRLVAAKGDHERVKTEIAMLRAKALQLAPPQEVVDASVLEIDPALWETFAEYEEDT